MEAKMKPKTNDVVVLPAGKTVYFTRSQEEVQALIDRDRATGNTMDCAGESRLYSSQGALRLLSDTTVVVTRTRGVEWGGWNKKPKGLMEGITDAFGRPVRFTL